MMHIKIAGQELHLLPERALFWPERGTLIIADVHLGKAATFRAAAIAVPEGAAAADLERLSRAITRTGARRLLVLGDLIHARQGRDEGTIALFANWRTAHATLDLLLVRGNHDRSAGDPPAAWAISCVNEPHVEPPFAMRHYPGPTTVGYALAGHLHPAVALQGRGRQRERLPAFIFGPEGAILPAFGSFTGAATVQPSPSDQVFVVADASVIQVQ